MAKVKVYGHLKQHCDPEVQLSITTVGEAIKALCVNFPGFKEALEPGEYHVIVDGKDISEGQLTAQFSEDTVIKLVPVVQGAKEGGFLQIVLGAALIVASIYVPVLPELVAQGMMAAGIGMVIGGVAQLLMPMPSSTVDNVNRSDNKRFGSLVNTQAQGTCVPVVYGRVMVGSKVLSAGIYTSEGKEVSLTSEALSMEYV